MSKLRSVSTNFWSDPFIEELSPKEKLLFLYLVTNEKTNMLGIYESSIKKISFETGLTNKEVSNALEGFEKVGKVKYINNYIILVNFLKHQKFNTNMKKSAIDTYNNLPIELKNNDISISKDEPLEGFETLLNHFGMVRKIEVEIEVEIEEEIEDTFLKNSFDLFWDKYPKKIAKQKCFDKFCKLKRDEVKVILETIDEFINYKPFENYTHPNPLTYLNQKRWEDEIPKKEGLFNLGNMKVNTRSNQY
ncbi:hypothetical protein [Tenacibaculum phage JQ]|nr:hypothetical protein [Tenacibaculum phage JQ]